MPASKAQIKANYRYNHKEYDQITFRARKGLNLPARIDHVAGAADISKASWLLDAVLAKLKADEESLGISDEPME